MLEVRGVIIFCSNCASKDLVLVEDELLSSIAESKSLDVVKCENCLNYFSKEFVEENFEDFSSNEVRDRIFQARMERSAMYRKQDEERLEQIKKEEAERAKKKQLLRKVHGRKKVNFDPEKQHTLFVEKKE